MNRRVSLATALVVATTGLAVIAVAQVKSLPPVTQDMLLNPSPDDWLMHNRTYDAQRFSPLNQINRQNVGQLKMVWSKPMTHDLVSESIPLVYRGVMYVIQPGAAVWALDATNGQLIWEHKRNTTSAGRSKNLAIYEDLVFYTAPDGFVVALDAGTGQVRWETKTDGGLTSGPMVVEGNVISGRTCAGRQANCYISGHNAKTGKEVWRFYTAAGDDDPGGATWGGAPVATRAASTWGGAGSYDPVRRLLYYGVANPTPYTRLERHGGTIDAISRSAPADLYSNSTLALDPQTGELAWYYQHLPGDDWDLDYTNGRTLLRTAVAPDPKFVKWINPDIPRGEERDVVVTVGEGGGIFTLDRTTGQFLWATPYPYDTPQFLISNIDVKTGKTYINWDLVFKKPGERKVICFWNTINYWHTAYHPGLNSLYVPFADTCLEMWNAAPATEGKPEVRQLRLPVNGSDPFALGGLTKVNMATGEIRRFHADRSPGNGAVLATAGDLVFWGDINQRFRAFDAESGAILWETILGGVIQNSTITYAVGGRQYVAVMTGEGQLTGRLINQAGVLPPRRHNEIYVFALGPVRE